MGTTANFQIPYPELTDPPDGAGQMKALATKVDTSLLSVAAPGVVRAVTGGTLAFASSFIKYNLTSMPANSPPVAHLSSGALVIDVAGWYQLIARCAMTTAEATTVVALAQVMINISGGSQIYGQGRGCASIACTVTATGIALLPAAATVDLQIAGANQGAGAIASYASLELVRVSTP